MALLGLELLGVPKRVSIAAAGVIASLGLAATLRFVTGSMTAALLLEQLVVLLRRSSYSRLNYLLHF
jgi:hypothetical protein